MYSGKLVVNPLIKDKVYKTVERRLYTLDALRMAVRDARAELDGKHGTMEGGGGHCFISDPTAAQAMKQMTPLHKVMIADARGNLEEVHQPEKWLYIIDGALRQLDDDRRNVIKARYHDKRRVVNITIDNPAGERTVYTWCHEFVHEVSLLAVAYGLIKIKRGDER